MGRRALLIGTGCAALGLLGACARKSDPDQGPKAGGVLIAKEGVPVGGGVLTQENVLVLQLKEGEFTAFQGNCPHQQFLVRPPDADGIMTCTGHQSKFRATDGVRVDGPALADLTPINVTISGANVVRA